MMRHAATPRSSSSLRAPEKQSDQANPYLSGESGLWRLSSFSAWAGKELMFQSDGSDDILS